MAAAQTRCKSTLFKRKELRDLVAAEREVSAASYQERDGPGAPHYPASCAGNIDADSTSFLFRLTLHTRLAVCALMVSEEHVPIREP